MMSAKAFQRFLDRDNGRCLHCGTTEGLVPQHRANRGMGGSKLRNAPANVIVFCSLYNGVIESDARAQQHARERGWKLEGWQFDYRLTLPVYDVVAQSWFFLDDDYHRTAAA